MDSFDINTHYTYKSATIQVGEQSHRTPQRDCASKSLQNYRASQPSQIHTMRWKIPYVCITASATVTAN